jgi:benzodiazapine receptor
MQKYKSLPGFLALVFLIAAVSSYVTMPAVNSWYQHINKPSWTPPDLVFGPVWTTLYIMIAISGWRVWRTLPPSHRFTAKAMCAYWWQLLFNFLWSIVFFGMHQFAWAAADIYALIIAVTTTLLSFRSADKIAAWLLMPYLLWVIYASTLNVGMLAMN